MSASVRSVPHALGALFGVAILLAPAADALAAQAVVVSAFEGSVEMGVCEADFDVLAYATAVAMEPDVQQV